MYTSTTSTAPLLDDVLLADGALKAEHAFAFELPHDGDDALLGSFDFLDLYRTQRLHVLAQHIRAALRHATQDVVAQLFAGAFECDGEHLAIRLSQDLFQAHGVDQ